MKEELDKKCYIDKVYSFENFITNESNIEIFELLKNYPNMNMKYNPIVIEGIFGTGKTHLLNAFKNEYSDKYNIKIVDCFDFTYDLTNNLGNKTMNTFLEKYNSADILCIDNIIFLSDRETTQEYLVEIIDKYIRNNKQVIITTISELSIGFSEMLKSKIYQGIKFTI
ncbi:DnaA ATPase domain-containing protein [Aliarcobacter butzleri]|uniref:DnaA ATPase domain-containing protein n=1 Tax=Aliarcobacter butzleri TaxID=28197 RepID=UPI001ED9FA1D|nr:DnaA/Hda family protein [Aliarcobacter butzleri]MCG3655278.1 DnaA/Hda family protein [Aliarcobacter butzleri]MCG3717663.1 DnaA/Hda family protein [Aliarcobacter butzleri]MCT7614059.1 DnaA/Hda family protein [Aliarcobacter butzleri]MDK2049984.1 DnaA/Hda family protein [Aliarcobacter butzleri]